ncbi:GlxA family transcriptional regulator [Desulfosarcina ovata]|uniref:AraC family transcriptional regulator n=1 Tax=Desulfosarcina ovata subsp. ovata TaxID=2752305 RepID=A0A5K8A8R2_9BACT|nr:helix-turn-helix domain-containing protein [Desulfosarcina ovata]BBO88925.1 AraC family transcriptional regulator [Desulfosarcina ovata subsp. ovata]
MGATIRRITILGCYNAMATTLFGPMDIFNQAGRLWNRLGKLPQTPFFDVVIASVDGKPIRCLNNVLVQPHCSIDAVDSTDLIIIASTTYIDKILETGPGLVPWIRRQYARGAHVASVCTGVFLLAETGLLDGRSATLHWGFADMFRKRYPRVNVNVDRMFIDQGRLYCAAGANAGMDLSLYLVEKFCGRQTAIQCAKTMILDMGRERQTPYGAFLLTRSHGDPVVTSVQEWMEAHHTETIDYDRLAKKHRISRRSLERRFKQATGLTPLGYLQQLRVDSAKRLLEDGRYTVAEIVDLVGYADISFFRKIFVKLTGLQPRAYQQRFGGYADAGSGNA